MVAVRRPRLPVGRLARDRRHDRLPREHLRERQVAVHGREPGLVAEDPAERDGALAASGELRPVGRDGRVQVQHAALDEKVDRGRRQPLRRREEELDRVLLPEPPSLEVREPGPQVDHRLAVPVDGACGAHVAVAVEVRREGVADVREAARDPAVDAAR